MNINEQATKNTLPMFIVTKLQIEKLNDGNLRMKFDR